MTDDALRGVLEKLCLPCKKDPFRELMKKDIDKALQSIKDLGYVRKSEMELDIKKGIEVLKNIINNGGDGSLMRSDLRAVLCYIFDEEEG